MLVLLLHLAIFADGLHLHGNNCGRQIQGHEAKLTVTIRLEFVVKKIDIQDDSAKESHLDWEVSSYLTDVANKEPKWSGYHTMPELYEMMCFHLVNNCSIDKREDAPAMKTFRRVFKHWSGTLKIRALGQHAR